MNPLRRLLIAAASDLIGPWSARAAGRRSGGTLVLCLHGVTERFAPAGYRSSHILRPEFETLLDGLLRVFRPVSLDEALTDPAGTGDRPQMVLTFDDGYRDHLTVAAPLLVARRVPAAFFVTTAGLGADGRPHLQWFDRIRLAVGDARNSGAVTEVLGGHGLPTDGRAVGALRGGTPERIDRVLSDLAAAGAGPDLPGDSHLHLLAAEDLRALDGEPLFTVGSHGVHHVDLAGQEESVQQAELERSRATLSECLGRPVEHLAYPSGSYDARTPGLAREAGYRAALTTDRRWWRPGTDPLCIPRLVVGIGRASYCWYKAATLG